MPKPNKIPSNIGDYIHYAPDTGDLTWLVDRGGTTKAGTQAGCTFPRGYIRVNFNNKSYSAHRIAFFLHTGIQPVLDIDHIDGNPANNRANNLREASRSCNLANKPCQKRTASGVKGAYYDKSRNLWLSAITVNGKQRNLGRFSTPEQANAAYMVAAMAHFGDFARA